MEQEKSPQSSVRTSLNEKEININIDSSLIRVSRSDERVSSSTITTTNIPKTNSFKSEKDVTFAPSVDEHENRRLSGETRNSGHSGHSGTSNTSSGGPSSNKSKHSDNSSANSKLDRQESRGSINSRDSPKVPRKFITNWRQACDRTKDRTKELLKKWRTLPEIEVMEGPNTSDVDPKETTEKRGWSVHVWSTWVNRYSEDVEGLDDEGRSGSMRPEINLTSFQKDKFVHFFTAFLDTDRDDVISEQDIEHFVEKLRHFADWSPNSPECNILMEVQQGIIDTFIKPSINKYEGESDLFSNVDEDLLAGFISLDSWLTRWFVLTDKAKCMTDFPIWLQYLCKVIFHVINRSGSGIITRDELSAFYSSVLGMDATTVGEYIDQAYKSMTGNGDYTLRFPIYHLCFANYLLGKYPNGPGQWVFGPPGGTPHIGLFPVDYSALNADPGDLEHYTPDKKSNRRSVVV